MPDRKAAVVIPAFNGEAHIEATVASVVAQGDAVAEIQIVDDSSTDKTPEVLARLASSNDKIRVLRTTNMGQNAARNIGASLTSAPILKFLDQDDLLPAGSISRQLPPLTEGRADIVIGDIARFHLEDEIEPLLEKISGTDAGHEKRLENIVTACRTLQPTFNEILLTRAAFDQAGGFNPRLGTCEEFDFAVRLHLNAPGMKVVHIPGPAVVLKRCGDHSLGTHYRERKDTDRNWAQACGMELARTILDEGHEITPLLKEAVFDSLYQISAYAFRGGRTGYGIAGYEIWKEAGVALPDLSPGYHHRLHQTLGFVKAERFLGAVRKILRPSSS